MGKVKLGEIILVNPREVWNNEERDFTPWLAENIDLVSSVIGIPIAVEQIEKRVGNYELDIYGKVEGTDKTVIIENQLEQSDHRHLGQLITYAVRLESSIIIWITPQVTDEHKTAIDWLNNISGDKTNFFLLRPEVIKIDDSKPAVRFQLEASPSDFVQNFRDAIEDEEAPRHIFRKWFWSEMFKFLAKDDHAWAEGRRATKDSWISSSIGKSGISVNVSMAQGARIRVEIYLDHPEPEKNTECYNLLLSNKDEIDAVFINEQVSWEALDDAKSSRVAVYCPYQKELVETDTEARNKLFTWISNNMKIMSKIAKKYLKSGNEIYLRKLYT